MSSIGAIVSSLNRKALAELLFWLTAAWVLLYVTLAVWGKEAFFTYVSALSRSLIMQVAFVLFIILFALSSGAFIYRKFRASRVSGIVWGVLPLGILLFMIGFYLSTTTSMAERYIVGVGDTVSPEFVGNRYLLSHIESGLGSEFVDIGNGDASLFTYEPRVYLDYGKTRHEVGVFPPTKIGGAYFHILDFGMAPGVRLLKEGLTLKDKHVVVRLFPPGNRDFFELDPFPYRFVTNLMPDRTIVKGSQKAHLYDMVNPRFELIVQKGEDIIYKGDSTDPEISFDGYNLEFYPSRYWVWLELSKNPGMVPLAAGMALILVGAPITLMAAIGRVLLSFRTRRAKGTDE